MNFPVKSITLYIFLIFFALAANAQAAIKEKSASAKPARTGVMKKISATADAKRKEEKSAMAKVEGNLPVKKETKPAPRPGEKAAMKKEPKHGAVTKLKTETKPAPKQPEPEPAKKQAEKAVMKKENKTGRQAGKVIKPIKTEVKKK